MQNDTSIKLYYGNLLIGNINRVFENYPHWEGIFEPKISRRDCTLQARILDFIQFCEDFNEREREGTDLPNPDEFDRFSDITKDHVWSILDSHDRHYPIDEWPVFFAGGDVSWTYISD